jgi:tetratricopeptide (TPR) repeat protein
VCCARRLTGSAGQAAASFDAYAHYLAGVQHWNKRTPDDLDKALSELKLATDMDPAFAPAWGAMGLCYVTLHLYGLRAPGDVIPLARTAVDRALRLDRHQVGALTARACIRAVHDWDMEAAERDFREVIAAAPSDALAQQWYAVNLLAPMGRYDEARAALARARELDPLSPAVAVKRGPGRLRVRQPHRRHRRLRCRALAGSAVHRGVLLSRGRFWPRRASRCRCDALEPRRPAWAAVPKCSRRSAWSAPMPGTSSARASLWPSSWRRRTRATSRRRSSP